MPDQGHGDRLSPIDASFLELETPQAHMHVAWSAIAAAPEDGAARSVEELRARVAARLDWVPRCRQRLLAPPLGVGEPSWIDAEDFDVADHVVEIGDASVPLTPERFAAARDALLSTPLDRSKPLWQLALAPRLSDGRMAVVGRVHHAMADGAAALHLATLLLDVDDAPEPGAPWRPAAPPDLLRRALDPVAHTAALAATTALDAGRACTRPRATLRRVLRDSGRAARALGHDMLPSAPSSPLNRPLSARRTLIQHRVSLAELRSITRGVKATRNDAGLAAVAGALRALAIERGTAPGVLKALVPVNVRRPDEHDRLGNRVSMTSVWLPLQLDSPAARLESLRRQTERFKRGSRAEGATIVLSGLGLLPAFLRATVLRATAPQRFNLTVSSTPGPRDAMYIHGARVEEIYPVIPMADEQALSVGMLTYDGHLHFGLYADPDALPHPGRVAELIDDELEALGAAAANGRTP